MRLGVQGVFALMLVCLLLQALAVPVAAQWSQIVGARISIVWPQDGAGKETNVTRAHAVNVSIWPTGQVGCSSSPSVQLLVARNNDVTSIAGAGQIMTRTVVSRTFPSVEFNDIAANLDADPTSKYRFVSFGYVTNSQQGFLGNIWAHAIDPRTYNPSPVAPITFTTSVSPTAGVDARIQIVYPHDIAGNFAPVASATRVNIAVEMFEHGTLNAVIPDNTGSYRASPSILVSEWNGALHPIASYSLQRITYTVGANTFPRWVFNDVPVVPGEQYHFVVWATTAGSNKVNPYATVWTHASDARTFLPYPSVPPSCLQ